MSTCLPGTPYICLINNLSTLHDTSKRVLAVTYVIVWTIVKPSSLSSSLSLIPATPPYPMRNINVYNVTTLICQTVDIYPV